MWDSVIDLFAHFKYTGFIFFFWGGDSFYSARLWPLSCFWQIFIQLKASELIKDHRKMPKRESDSMWNAGQSVRTVLMYEKLENCST